MLVLIYFLTAHSETFFIPLISAPPLLWLYAPLFKIPPKTPYELV